MTEELKKELKAIEVCSQVLADLDDMGRLRVMKCLVELHFSGMEIREICLA